MPICLCANAHLSQQTFGNILKTLGEGPLIGRPAAGVLKVWPRRGAYPTVSGLRNSIRSLLRGIAVNAVTARAGDIIPIMWRVLTRLLHRSIVASFSGGPSRDQPRKPRGERGGDRGLSAPSRFAASSCGQLARVAVSFLGRLKRKHSSRTPEEKEKVRFLRSGSLTPAVSQRPKKRELSPRRHSASATSTASCSGPLEPDTCIFPGEPISGIHACPRSVLAGICAGSKACNKGPERSCIEFVGPEKTRRRSNLRRRSYRSSAKGGNSLVRRIAQRLRLLVFSYSFSIVSPKGSKEKRGSSSIESENLR